MPQPYYFSLLISALISKNLLFPGLFVLFPSYIIWLNCQFIHIHSFFFNNKSILGYGFSSEYSFGYIQVVAIIYEYLKELIFKDLFPP